LLLLRNIGRTNASRDHANIRELRGEGLFKASLAKSDVPEFRVESQDGDGPCTSQHQSYTAGSELTAPDFIVQNVGEPAVGGDSQLGSNHYDGDMPGEDRADRRPKSERFIRREDDSLIVPGHDLFE